MAVTTKMAAAALYKATVRFQFNCICNAYRFASSNGVQRAKFQEVGKIMSPKLDGRYNTGQLFLHKVFGYRGVVLLPWIARVFDRDALRSKKVDLDVTEKMEKAIKEKNENVGTFSSTNTYYQVLIDTRDYPFIRAQTESVTFLGSNDSNRSLYAIPGLDYVAHEDIIPYTTTEKHPIQHELFEKFLKITDEPENPIQGLESLIAWQSNNHPWLELSDVHKETTEKIRVTVIPFYMGWRESTSSYWWRYCIRLENFGEDTVYLRERHWRIFSLSGTLETVRGRGVVGQEPILSKSLPAFQYSSHVSLQCPAGHMWGTFKMEREDGYCFECKIPAFSLDSKTEPKNEG